MPSNEANRFYNYFYGWPILDKSSRSEIDSFFFYFIFFLPLQCEYLFFVFGTKVANNKILRKVYQYSKNTSYEHTALLEKVKGWADTTFYENFRQFTRLTFDGNIDYYLFSFAMPICVLGFHVSDTFARL